MVHDDIVPMPLPQSTPSFVGLPSELIELVIVYAAVLSPVSVAPVAQTCRAMRVLIYGPSDQHLWREIFLTTFDDPRLADRADKTDPYMPYRGDTDEDSGRRVEITVAEKGFDWRREFCERVWGLRYFQRVTATHTEERERALVLGDRFAVPSKNVRAMESLLSAVRTALPSPPTVVISILNHNDPPRPGDSPFAQASRQLPIFPPSPALCTTSTILRVGEFQTFAEPHSIAFGYDTAKNIRWLEKAVANGYPPELTLLLSGCELPGGLQGLWDDELEAQEMHAFSRLVCFTGFLPIPQRTENGEKKQKWSDNADGDKSCRSTEAEASGIGSGGHDPNAQDEPATVELDLPEDEAPASTDVVAEENVIGTTLTYASATEPVTETQAEAADEDAYEATQAEDNSGASSESKLPMDVASQKRRARRIARMRVYNMQYLTRERHWGPYLLPAWSKLKDKDDDLEIDFLNPIIELFAEHDAGHPHHHHHHDEDNDHEAHGNVEENDEWESTTEEDENEDITQTILQFPPDQYPPPPLPAPNELYADWTYLAAVRIVVEANLREAVRSEALSGLTWLDGLRRGSAPKAVGHGLEFEKSQPTGSPKDNDKGKGKAKEEVGGWDWAGVEGDWKRCVCWLDYRDLILHNLARQFNDPNLQEAVRIVPMRLRIASYSSCSVPEYTHRPTIHVVGETAGPAGSGSIRKMKGTVGMIADGNIRWNLYSYVDESGPAEWVTEGIQIGEATSGMGVLGMWTGAQHERMDPLGPFWSWKVG